MAKEVSEKTPICAPATNDVPADFIEFGLLLEQGVPKGKAAVQVWPGLRTAKAKGTKVCSDPRFKAWQVTRRDVNEQRVRHITATLGADYESRITALATAFNDPEVKTRERLQIHDKLTTAEGRRATSDKEPASGNSLKKILEGIGAGAVGGALSAGVRDGRFPALRTVFPEDTEQDGVPRSDDALAPSASVLGRP